MAELREGGTSVLTTVSNAMVALHREQFGRGAARARAGFAGPDTLVCVLEDVLLPAERKLVAMGEQARVRETRSAFQAATRAEFVAAVEQTLSRKVRAFASGIDPDTNVVFENFVLEPADANSTNGRPAADGS